MAADLRSCAGSVPAAADGAAAGAAATAESDRGINILQLGCMYTCSLSCLGIPGSLKTVKKKKRKVERQRQRPTKSK